jgi:hypothetical protein
MHITVEFIGGPMDGEVAFRADTRPQAGTPAWLAWMFYRLTGGEIGRKGMVPSPAMLEVLRSGPFPENPGTVHYYEVGT